jgi:hypothetical protein
MRLPNSHKNLFFISLLAIFLSTIAEGKVLKIDRRLAFSLGTLNQYYFEHDDQKAFPTNYADREYGNLPLLSMKYAQRNQSWITDSELSLASGSVTYDGYSQPANQPNAPFTPIIESKDNIITTINLRFGRIFQLNALKLMTGLSLGHQYWKRMLNGLPLVETYTHQSLGFWTGIEVPLKKNWFLDWDASVGFLLQSKIDVPFSQYQSSLGSRSIFTTSLGIAFQSSKEFRYFFRSRFKAFRYDQGAFQPDINNPGFFIFEPRSYSLYYNLEFGIELFS